MKIKDSILCGHHWMNNFCPQCRHYYTDSSLCYCKIPDVSQDMVNKAIKEGDQSVICGKWNHPLNQCHAEHCLPCFEPKLKVKIPLWRLPVAILLGIILTPISIVGLFLVIGIGTGMAPYEKIPWPIGVILILMGCIGAILLAISWYKKEIWQDLWKK